MDRLRPRLGCIPTQERYHQPQPTSAVSNTPSREKTKRNPESLTKRGDGKANTRPNSLRGEIFKVALHGSLSEDVEEGAYYDYTSRLGRIKLAKETHFICTDDDLDIECPQKQGDDIVWESKDIAMGRVPPGQFNLALEGFTVDDAPLFCIRATADMRRSWPEVEDAVAFRVQA